MEWLEAFNPFAAYGNLRDFLETGGWVLYVIMGATFVMWVLIVERYWFFRATLPGLKTRTLDLWQARENRQSWYAHKVRERMISELSVSATDTLGLIKTLVAVAPMLGLLGTVTGMVEVFDVMALTGASNARAMAAGVAKATLPTMAGMVASLSGLYFSAQLERRAKHEVEGLADRLAVG